MVLNARVDVNCGRKDGRTDGRKDGRTDGRTENRTLISHLAKAGAISKIHGCRSKEKKSFEWTLNALKCQG